jgi:hypothetical protein
MALQNVVQSYAAVDITYPRRIVKDGATAPANVVLKVGDSSGVKSLAYSRSYSLTTYMTKVQKEVTTPLPSGV